ncbi:MAG TPA: PP2C family protein-serine/threonine phosphatase [Spirochaetota bacterium]|nr:PP2C family protein-serine/threonine phosphatase [Spirochaetota bacterium]HNT12442.1 PP2C family protein-serine/threonine phosphatase [Spirochaetota bacterium]HPU87433.1 PP2C family protein-serine/threonine phosphatase [Spirochaetota bacterium]
MTPESEYDQDGLLRAARRLRFPSFLESSFLDYYHNKTILFIRWASVFGILLYLANLNTDFISFPGLERLAIGVRVGFVVYGVIILALSFVDAVRRRLHFLLFLISVIGSGCVVVFTLVGSGPFASLYHSGVMLCLVFTFAFVRLRFRHATASGVLVGAGYIIPHALIGDLPGDQLAHNAMNLLGTIGVGMCIAYLNEYHLRYSFVQELVIGEKSRTLEAQNALIDHELEIAKTIQEQYLPASGVHGRIGALYRPMDRVGGDFFDIITFADPDEIGVFISDVSGHGVPAALYTSMLRVALTQAGDLQRDPQGLLGHLDRALLPHLKSAFITCFYGVLNMRSGDFRYANAGHLAPLIVSADSIEPLPCPPSVPLAAFSESTVRRHERDFSNRAVTLPTGSRLLLFTDGLTEARNRFRPAEMFEYAGMHDALRSAGAMPVGAFIDRLFEALVGFRGGDSFEDDICILCLEVG